MTDAVRRYVDAVSKASDETAAALREVLADDVTFVGFQGAAQGPDDTVAAATNPMLAGLLATAEWSDPEADGGAVVVRAAMAPGFPLAAATYTIWIDGDGRIDRIAQELKPAPPPPAQPMQLTDDIKSIIDNALTNGTPILVSYVDRDGAPHMSLRGSTQAHSDTQLAMWNRDPNGGMSRAIAHNPHVALFYRDAAKRVTYTFSGRASLVTDPAIAAQVYEKQPALDRNQDPLQRGVAVMIDLDRVEGGSLGNQVVMEA